MFEMYDINRSGTLSPDEFKGMIRSMVEAANADVDEEELEKMTKLMLKGLGRDVNMQIKYIHFLKLVLTKPVQSYL